MMMMIKLLSSSSSSIVYIKPHHFEGIATFTVVALKTDPCEYLFFTAHISLCTMSVLSILHYIVFHWCLLFIIGSIILFFF